MKMRIGPRILTGFSLVLSLTVGLGWYGLAKLSEVNGRTSEVTEHDFLFLALLQDISHNQTQMRTLAGKVMTASLLRRSRPTGGEDPLLLQELWRQGSERAIRLLDQADAAVAETERASPSAQRGSQYRKMRQTIRETQDALKDLGADNEVQFGLINRGEWEQLLAQTARQDQLRQVFDGKIAALVQLIREQVEIGRAEMAGVYEEAKTSTLIALAAAVLLGVLSSIVIQRSITRPLSRFMEFVGRVGQGDLTQQAPVARQDELGDLAGSFNQMVAGLKDVAIQTREATESLNAATSEILASTQQQAAGTSEQAAAVQQTNATMAEISQSGSQISERAKQVASAAEATSAAGNTGLHAVLSTTRTMEAIREQAEAVAENVVSLSEKTQSIGEIIATVNDVAEQSHLLALNAAIEASAAGDQGRRFAVVASEIKNLADQSKEATVRVRTILGDIQKGINTSVMLTEEAVKRAESGKQQADAADQAIRQLSENIQQSVQAFQQIVAGANQQQIGFDQVTQAIRNIGQASEQTANSTKQLEQAAANVNALGQQLRKAVERYRL
jgi:methyl-accepting chemotaxis protein